MPTEQIASSGALKRMRCFEWYPIAFLYFGPRPFNAAILQHEFEAHVLADRAIPELTMKRENSLRQRFQMLRPQESQHVCQPGEGLGIAMRHTHTAAGQQIVAFQLATFGDDDEAKVIRKDVDVVERRNSEPGL